MKNLRKEMHFLYQFISENLGRVLTIEDIIKNINQKVSKRGKFTKYDILAMIRMNNKFTKFEAKRNITSYIFLDLRRKKIGKVTKVY